MLDCYLYFSQQNHSDQQTTTTTNTMSTVSLLVARTLTNKEQQAVDKDSKYSLVCFPLTPTKSNISFSLNLNRSDCTAYR